MSTTPPSDRVPSVGSSDLTPPPAQPVVDATPSVVGQSTVDDASPHAAVPDLPAVPGYEVRCEIGHGGMGRVYAGYDRTLDREVAIKTLLPGAEAARFVTEARITARLPHPGIPPVHALGTLPDGSHYLVMKLIRGRTLAELLRDRKSPIEDLPRWVQVFEQIAQAVGFAHAQGIIHRDLKPHNLMVGAFGEVQVLDWGLAKDLRTSSEEQNPTSRERERVDQADHTAAGAIVGTPAYMAPEQARGEGVDQRTDVFALGSILTAILTGKPAFQGATARDIVAQAAAGDPADARGRLDACEADRDLIALAKCCIAAQPAERPADARAVAECVAAYQTGVQERLRRAEVERAAAQVKAVEERRRRWIASGLALSGLLVVVVAGVGYLSWQEQRTLNDAEKSFHARLTRNDVATTLATLDGLYQRFLWEEADKQLRRTEDLVGPEGDSDLRERLGRARRKTRLFRELDEARLARSVLVNGDFDYDNCSRLYRGAFEHAGFDVVAGSAAAVAEQMAAEEDDVRDALVAALDDWAFTTSYFKTPNRRALRELAQAVDNDPWRKRFRAAAADGDNAGLRASSAEARQAQLPASSLNLIAVNFRARGEWDEALALQRLGCDRHPTDFWLHLDMGGTLSVKPNKVGGETEEAFGYLLAARALRPDIGTVHVNLALALHNLHRYDEAIAAYGEAIRHGSANATVYFNLGICLNEGHRWDDAIAAFQKVVEIEPNNAGAYSNLGNALMNKNQLTDALVAHRKAVELAPKDAEVYSNLGLSLCESGQFESAIAELRKALELDPTLATAQFNLGIALMGAHQLDDALAAYRKAIELGLKDAAVHYNLGIALKAKDQLDDAIAEFKKAIDLDPKYAAAHNSLGMALHAKGKSDDAIAEYKKAIDLDPKSAPIHNNLAGALYAKNRLDDAIAEFKKAIDLDPKDADAHYDLGVAFKSKNQLDAAIAEFKKAIELDSKHAKAHCSLGLELRDQGKLAESLGELRLGDELGRMKQNWSEPSAEWLRQAESLSDLDGRRDALLRGEMAGVKAADLMAYALFRHGRGKLDEAVVLLQQTVVLQPDWADAQGNLSWLLSQQEKWTPAAAAAQKAIELNARVGWYHNNYGWALENLGQLEEADAAYRKAIKLDNNPGSSALANLKNLEPLLARISRLEAVRKGEAKPTDAAECLELAKLAVKRKQWVLATRLYEIAFTDKPALADDLKSGNRYDAACYAALAAAGQAKDADKLNDKERSRLRKHAVEWLHADLDLWAKRLSGGEAADREAVRDELEEWEDDDDLAGIRDKDTVAKLPPDEREACHKLWADVAELLKKAKDEK